jgi:prolyl oligopeptidase
MENVAQMALVVLMMFGTVAAAQTAEDPADPYRWLEDIDGVKALEWVHEQNARTEEILERDPRFDQLHAEALAALNAETRVPRLTKRGEYLYNLWQDAAHPRGIYRRTTLEQLRRPDTVWETVLDIDALAAREGTNWVFKRMDCPSPEYRRCLVSLSPGGGDAVEIREFDMETLAFVEGGFFLPVAKSNVGWRDEDALYVATDFGPGSMTTSGYPRIVRLWRRGEPLVEAGTLHEGETRSVSVSATRIRTDEGDIDLVSEATSFWTNRRFHLLDGELHDLALPETAVVDGGFNGKLVVSLKDPWTVGGRTFPPGSIVLAAPEALHEKPEGVTLLFAPGERQVVEEVTTTSGAIAVTILDDVRGRLLRFEETEDGWNRRSLTFPDNGTVAVRTSSDETGELFVEYESFTSPPTLYHVAGPDWKPERILSQTATFDGSRFETMQYRTTSKDGTEIPYFVVMPKGLERDGRNPTHIFSYGGFRVALTPSYSGSYENLFGAYGKMWLERGGVYVVANIRGGGEFGPEWHTAALRENRVRSFEDFEAVAEDLIRRKITSGEHLGIEGRSNGGLLVGATMTRRPDLYGATIIGVPLADMRRYHELLAGASWMAEFGDPDDPEDWAFISEYSPYHNLQEAVDYPPAFVFTSTRDDRVHPGHARKLVAKLLDLDQEVYYWENLEGGHGGSVTNEQMAYRIALAFMHLWRELGPAEVETDPEDTAPERRRTRKE